MKLIIKEMSINQYDQILALWQSSDGVGLSEADSKKIEAMTEAVLNKILHRPIARMKKAAHHSEESDVSDMVRKIFELDK